MVQKVIKNNKFSHVFVIISIPQYVQEEEDHSHRHQEQQIHPEKERTNTSIAQNGKFFGA